MCRGHRSQREQCRRAFVLSRQLRRENRPPQNRGLSHSESRRRQQTRQHLELIEQSVVEFASALIGRKLLMPIGWNF